MVLLNQLSCDYCSYRTTNAEIWEKWCEGNMGKRQPDDSVLWPTPEKKAQSPRCPNCSATLKYNGKIEVKDVYEGDGE